MHWTGNRGSAVLKLCYTCLMQAEPDVFMLDLAESPYPAGHRQHKPKRYSMKVYSLLFTRFSQVLLLDADNLPLKGEPNRLNSHHAAIPFEPALVTAHMDRGVAGCKTSNKHAVC